MKNLKQLCSTFAFCILFSSQICSAHVSLSYNEKSFLVISDVDDTLRITNTLSYPWMLWNVFRTDHTFLGMAELFQEFKAQLESIVYLSGSPESLSNSLHKLLFQKRHFPEGFIQLRDWFKLRNYRRRGPLGGIYYYKTEKLNQFAKMYSAPFLFFGDDEEKDPEVFTDFTAAQSKGKVLSIYIHQITGRTLPKGVIPYSTAFDIALNEVHQGRLTSEQAVHVGRTILEAKEPVLLFPHFKKCPRDFTYDPKLLENTDSELFAISMKMQFFIRDYCVSSKPPSQAIDQLQKSS